jgi:hypothetical protein
MLSGFALLLTGLVWAAAAGQWSRQHYRGHPIAPTYRMVWPGLIQAVTCLILSAFCLAPAFQIR